MKKLKGQELIDYIGSEIKRIAREKGLDPYDVTRVDILANSRISHWDLRKCGGLTAVRKATIPIDDSRSDLIAKRSVALNKNYISKLERQAGDVNYIIDSLGKKLDVAFRNNPVKVSKRPKQKKLNKSKTPNEVVAMISDTHWGLGISPDEVPSNEVNWTIASRRMGKFAQQIAGYNLSNRDATKRLRLCLGGDLIQGIIHFDDSGIDLITYQVVGAIHILTNMIDYLRGHFNEIRVECTPCNHARMTYRSHNRALKQKYDSFATIIHCGLQAAFRSAKDVSFNVPKTPYTSFDVFGRSFFMTHGDTVIEIGNPGTSVNTKHISTQINNINANMDKKYEVVMVGHAHTPLQVQLTNGVWFLMNGTASGIDPYAQSVGFFNNAPSQIIYQSMPDRSVDSLRVVSLRSAGEETEFDSIVEPYDYSLVLGKKK